MDTDDEDAEWLQACMKAVDNVAAANISSSTSTSTSSAGNSVVAVNTRHHAGTTVHNNSGRRTSPSPSSFSSSSLPVPCQAGVRNSLATLRPVGTVMAGRPSTPSGISSSSSIRPTQDVRAVPSGGPSRDGASALLAHRSTTGLAAPRPWAMRKPSGHRGVGVNPYDDDEHMQQTRVTADPCWRCGEPVVFKNYGTSSHPLCNATRKGSKNGPVMHLVAAEDTSTATLDIGHGNSSMSQEQDDANHGSISRCRLVVTVRGGQQGNQEGSETHKIWNMLRREGIMPTQQDEQSGDASSVSSSRGVRAREKKAVLDLTKRELVRKLAKKANITYRDIPQATYARLASSRDGRGVRAGSAAASNHTRTDGKAGVSHQLEPTDVCRGLLHTLPALLRETLLPFQREGVMYGLKRRGRCLIADEMGTGKVLQLASAKVRGFKQRVVELFAQEARLFSDISFSGSNHAYSWQF